MLLTTPTTLPKPPPPPLPIQYVLQSLIGLPQPANLPRIEPKQSITISRSPNRIEKQKRTQKEYKNTSGKICAECQTTNTPCWRKDSQLRTVCNKCGVALKRKLERQALPKIFSFSEKTEIVDGVEYIL